MQQSRRVMPSPGQEQQLEWPHPRELQLQAARSMGHEACVGTLEVQTPQPAVQLGFMCGSLPVPTVSPTSIASSTPISSVEAALIPAISLQSQRAAAPRYRLLPMETDLNTPPSNGIQPEQLLPVTTSHDAGGLCSAWGGGYLSQPMARKCEALAVSALTGYGDEIDVVAPVDILKQIFKTPYCKGRLSVAVHRIGRTLILNSGPDIEEGEKLARRKKNQTKAMERALFSKFVQHSVHGEACDASGVPQTPATGGPSNNRRAAGSASRSFAGSESGHVPWHVVEEHENGSCCSEDEICAASRMPTKKGKPRISLSHCRRTQCGVGLESIQKARFMREKQHDSEFVPKDAEKPPRSSTSEGFLRVLFWQFQNLRMLLGSDLLLFSNDKHAAVSLHLMEIGHTLMWLDAWLDNVMASTPELAVCYHRNGVVQGYELLKTDDIFLLKGLSEDGTAVFHPHVVQQNASSVLRFLQENCKQDPGTYWLFKNAGEDMMQLFDLSVVSKRCSTCGDKEDKGCGTLPSCRNQGNGHYSLPLAMLLYRLANRLSRSQDPADRCKCAKLFGKCLEFMDEQEHLVIRASAHEHVARLILACYKELGSMVKPLLLESGKIDTAVNTELKQPALGLPSLPPQVGVQEDAVAGTIICELDADKSAVDTLLPAVRASNHCCVYEDVVTFPQPEILVAERLGATTSGPVNLTSASIQVVETPLCSQDSYSSSQQQSCEVTPHSAGEMENKLAMADKAPKLMRTIAGPVSARLAAVHHISQAIKALRWQRQLQDVGDTVIRSESIVPVQNRRIQQVSECICGEIECVAICDFRDIEIGFGMDQKLWRLLLLLGDSYLSLGQAYKDDGQLGRALKAAELACLVHGYMPRSTVDTSTKTPEVQKVDMNIWHQFNVSPQTACKKNLREYESPLEVNLANASTLVPADRASKLGNTSGAGPPSTGKGLFWGKVWTFVGDVFAEIQRSLGETDLSVHQEASQCEELKMAQEVMKEVKRLKKKVSQLRGSCSICSLTSCSCENDRASSGNSASSSNGPFSIHTAVKYARKHNKKTSGISSSPVGSDVPNEKSLRSDRNLDSGVSRPAGDVPPGTGIVTGAPIDEAYEETRKIDLDSGVKELTHVSSGEGSTILESVGCTNARDIFSYLVRPMTVDWEMNLSAAVDCYTAAVVAYTEVPECCQDLEGALRKKGWACNELGRRRLAHGNVKAAEEAFETAIKVFREVKDFTNIVLVYCNLAHGRRAAAEVFASQLSAWEESLSPQFYQAYTRIVSETKFLYQEALKFYGTGRRELLGLGDGAERSLSGLWDEVHTQLAHTYLRLGMLLAREEKFAKAHRSETEGQRSLEIGATEDSRGRKLPGTKGGISAKDAILKALVLYESLGSLRAQEAAYAQFQLACHQRDCCLFAMAMQAEECGFEKGDSSCFQRAKRFASLADLYWQKALEYYRAETHPDMFLEILMQKSAVCVAVAPSSHPNLMLEQALSHLLEGRRVLSVRGSSGVTNGQGLEQRTCKPSSDVLAKFTQQLQTLLRTMLGVAMSAGKPSTTSCNGSLHIKFRKSSMSSNVHVGPARSSDVDRLREMYRSALTFQEDPDLGGLYEIWIC